ncbi:transmembrane protein 242-like [Brevipalpus obovatus]|uniref:transmembrane protein 242-like n=1 Tax=Brevipalpus obovatus TaxID=246614 RepID=UPI003D9E1729
MIEKEIEALFESKGESKRNYLKEALFLGGVASFSILLGFGSSLALAKKKDPEFFQKGLVNNEAEKFMSGVNLANKALKKATIYSVTGVSIISIIVYKFILPKKDKLEKTT